MPVQIKICGVTTAAALDAAARGGASHVGLVFFEPSPRNLSFDRAAELAQRCPPAIARVGVFVDPDDALVEAAVAAGYLDAIQLHGSETPERVAHLRNRTGIEIWKAIPVKTHTDRDGARRYLGAADRLIFDTKTDASLPGGMGQRFDWTLLTGWRSPLPWGLSGGLDADNVAHAIRTTRASLVDVSSSVESAPGIKDIDKIASFCQAVHAT